MTELEKFILINKSNNLSSLQKAIVDIADSDGMIECSNKKKLATDMSRYLKDVCEGIMSINCLTRNYGIRQQALYIIHYKKFD